MTQTEPAHLAEFRHRVRQWLQGHAATFTDDDGTRSRSERVAADDERGMARARACQRALFDAGLAGITWPTQYGGQGLGLAEQLIFNQEAQPYNLPLQPFTIGFGMCGPTILGVGNELQKQRYLERLLRADDMWCQMFSEPEAGSDLASLRTRAVRRDGEWVLNGQKIWISRAQWCAYGLILTRTDPDVPKHKGLTMFIIDLKSPGVSIRPIRVMNDEAHFNEIFLDDVRVPDENVVGAVGEGWTAALTTLMNERVTLGATRPLDDVDTVDTLLDIGRRHGTIDAQSRARLVDLWLSEHVLALLSERVSARVLAGEPAGPEGSVAKLVRTTYSKASAELALELSGAGSIAWPDDDAEASALARQITYVPVLSIAGGTDEVLKNVIGERILGLPREPAV
jgi:alkylation response protein AidB-like acyl-CoA dehydrogenase